MGDSDLQEERFWTELKVRLYRLDRGEGIELEDDAALRRFFDRVQTRGMKRYLDLKRDSLR